MRRFQGPIFTVAVTLSLLMGVLTVHRLLEPRRTCANWEGVREVSFNGQTIPACESVSRLQRPIAEEPLHEWVERLNKLDRLEWIKPSSVPVSIRFDEKNPQAFEVDNQLVTIGFALAEKPGQLEHAALLGWVKTNWPDHEETTQEVMADILTWMVTGDSNWADPTESDRTVDPATYLRLSLMPSSPANYCQSPFRSLTDLEACDLNTRNAEAAEISGPQTLRPLVSWVVWSFVKQLSYQKQIGFFKRLMKSHFQEVATEDTSSLDRRAWTKDKALTLLRHWGFSAPAQHHGMTKVLNSADLNSPLAFDLTVEVNDPILKERVIDSLKPWSKFYPNMRVLLVSPDKKIVFPEQVAVDLLPQEAETRRYVMLACNWPRPKETFEIKNHVFLAFQVCGNDKLPSWTEITHPKLPPLETRLVQ